MSGEESNYVHLESLPTVGAPGMHLVAVLTERLDGYRCYLAGCEMPVHKPHYNEEAWKKTWAAAEAAAVRHCLSTGNKIDRQRALIFFPMAKHVPAVRWAK